MMLSKQLALLLGISAALSAANAALPSTTYLGINKYIAIGNSRNGDTAGGNGGAFNGTAYNGATPATSTLSQATTFWCVDSQLYFNWNDAAGANIIALNSIAANPSQVRYGNVDESGAPTWTNSLGAPYDTAQERYKMAAFLVAKYDFQTPGTPQSGLKNVSGRNDAIQRTIWALMNNSTPGAETSGWTTFDSSTGWTGFGGKTIIEYAKENYAAANMKNWAVVSWAASNGSLAVNPVNSQQTFLVQLTSGVGDQVPEPGFYGLLCTGLGALVWTAKRRKKLNSEA